MKQLWNLTKLIIFLLGFLALLLNPTIELRQSCPRRFLERVRITQWDMTITTMQCHWPSIYAVTFFRIRTVIRTRRILSLRRSSNIHLHTILLRFLSKLQRRQLWRFMNTLTATWRMIKSHSERSKLLEENKKRKIETQLKRTKSLEENKKRKIGKWPECCKMCLTVTHHVFALGNPPELHAFEVHILKHVFKAGIVCLRVFTWPGHLFADPFRRIHLFFYIVIEHSQPLTIFCPSLDFALYKYLSEYHQMQLNMAVHN